MDNKEYNLEDVFSNKECVMQSLDIIFNNIKNYNCVKYQAENIDDNYEYVKNKLKEMNYSIEIVGKDEISNNNIYIITKNI